ncbi:MAG TPA: filamentous hemagglutinin family protein, partial [Opitutaceae bacterium]|nr:filamentous hemagglutinin family protein [Opitutaceae bacterium]
ISGIGGTATVKIVHPDGSTSTFPATTAGTSFTSTTLPVGSVVTLSGKSGKVTVTFSSSGTVVPLALSAGTYTTTGTATVTNSVGDLTLFNTWDLSTFRYGPNAGSVAGSGEPGLLTLRAAGNLVFKWTSFNSTSRALTAGSLSDGFGPTPANLNGGLWQSPLLPAGSRSWSYDLVAGADLSAADDTRVLPKESLGSTTGSIELGSGAPPLSTSKAGTDDSSLIEKNYQVIRTGTGDINIFAGRDVQLLNPLATIYTAGSQAPALPPDEFTSPSLTYANVITSVAHPSVFFYAAQYSENGGDVAISAQGDIAADYLNLDGTPSSSAELPTNWLFRRGYVNPSTGQFDKTHDSNATGTSSTGNKEFASTSWWIDFSNFFEGVGALGGGNVTLLAGGNVTNVDAVAPTNARTTDKVPGGSGTSVTNTDGTTGTYNQSAASQTLLELGGGDVTVKAGADISGGVYYVERGTGTLSAGGQITTNAARAAVLTGTIDPDSSTWLPTTLFLGQGSFNVTAGGDVLLGPVANPFLLPQAVDNAYFEKTYFSTYDPRDAVNVSSLGGDVTLEDNPASEGSFVGTGGPASLIDWYNNVLNQFRPQTLAHAEPWLGLVETTVVPSDAASSFFVTAAAVMPGTLRATAFSGDLNLKGGLTLSPSPYGTVDLAAAGSINGLQPNEVSNGTVLWDTSTINLSDTNPNNLPGVFTPASLPATHSTDANGRAHGASAQNSDWGGSTPFNELPNLAAFFDESGSTDPTIDTLQAQQALHGTVKDAAGNSVPLHAGDPNPVQIYARTGDISGLTLFSGEVARVLAGNDITDIALYVQNNLASDVSVVSAGRDIVAYDPSSALRQAAQVSGNSLDFNDTPQSSNLAGDIQISGPGTLEVLAGRNFTLGVGANNADGTAVGVTSIGNARNPSLPTAGASIVAGAGLGIAGDGLSNSSPACTNFIAEFLNPTSAGTEAARYLPDLGALMEMTGAGDDQIWTAFNALPPQQQDVLILDLFYLVLRDAGRDFHDPSSPGFGNYNNGFAAIAALFPGHGWQGDITLTSREIKTENGGDIDLFAPGGQLTVGLPVNSGQASDQGILTQAGGDISIFTNGNVNVGVSRIFTLRGGNEIIWSSTGNIAAGAASKTVQAAPPTRVLVDPRSANVETDLAGLATGGGIGVLAEVADVPVGNVDLIAPAGFVDAGDAGIRATGNLNIAAVQVLNSSNIQVGGQSSGTSAPVSAPSLGSFASVGNTTAAATSAADQAAKEQARAQAQQQQQEILPSIITVEVLGYGGGDGPDDFSGQKN